jgi:hypothetical protein
MSSKPKDARILSSIWSYRRTHSPTGKILKYKARISVDSSQQTYGRDYWEVNAPVVSWPTIHLMLLLSSILDLKQRQVDYMYILGALAKIHSGTQERSKWTRGDSTYAAGY